jgi:hypothetical protein
MKTKGGASKSVTPFENPYRADRSPTKPQPFLLPFRWWTMAIPATRPNPSQ